VESVDTESPRKDPDRCKSPSMIWEYETEGIGKSKIPRARTSDSSMVYDIGTHRLI
jgi:hypothetical protein